MSSNRKIKKLAVVFLTVLLVLSSAQTVLAKSGKWKQDGSMWWFEYDDGSYPANCITTIREQQFAFDVNGYMIYDRWVYAPGHGWFYCASNGALAKNQWIGNYYVGSDGAMLTNTWTPDGYWVNEEGEWDSSVPRQGSSSAGGTISSIPDGYYNSVGIGGDTQNYRVDCWVNYSGGSKQINFGHYEPTGSSYSFYDKNNPNGDTLDLYMENGTIYGRSTKSGHKSYKVEFDGTYLKIHWEYTTWNHNSKLIKVKLQNIAGGAVG